MLDTIDELYIHQLISKNLRRLRLQQGISQMDLAINTELTHNFINDIENCKKGISTKTLAKLSSILNAEPYQFFLPEDVSNNETSIYVSDFKSSLQTAVNRFTDRYLSGKKKRW